MNDKMNETKIMGALGNGLAGLELEAEVLVLRGRSEKEHDLFAMTYEDIRSQAFMYKLKNLEHLKTITEQNQEIFNMIKDKGELEDKIARLEKNLKETKFSLETQKSRAQVLDIKVKDNTDLIIYLKKNLELKSMGFEEYYLKYVTVYNEHKHLQNKHTVLSNRFAQYEFIVKTSKAMLEALKNRKNAKTQTEIYRNHDIAIMTDLVWKDISNSRVFPSVSSNRSRISLYPDWQKQQLESKEKKIQPSRSYNPEMFEDSSKFINLEDSVGRFRLPQLSNKTVNLFGDSKVKLSFMESQLSSIKKVISRYDSKKSSESAEELGVDLFETINQINEGQNVNKSTSSKRNTKLKAYKRKRSRSVTQTHSGIESISVQHNGEEKGKTNPSDDENIMNKVKPLMRKKFDKDKKRGKEAVGTKVSVKQLKSKPTQSKDANIFSENPKLYKNSKSMQKQANPKRTTNIKGLIFGAHSRKI